MTIYEQIEQKKQQHRRTLSKKIAEIENEINDLQSLEIAITANRNYPIQDVISRKLEERNGSTVLVIASNNNNEEKVETLKLEYDQGFIKFNSLPYPLLGNNFVKEIIDTKTGEIIFNNECADKNKFFQQAKYFGKLHAIDNIEREKAALEMSRNFAISIYEDVFDNLNNVPYYASSAQGVIYPELEQEYKDLLIERAENVFCNPQNIMHANFLMLSLNDGLSIDKIKELTQELSSKANKKDMADICETVLKFSKRGPEFFENTVEDRTKEQEKLLKDTKERNINFERAEKKVSKLEDFGNN